MQKAQQGGKERENGGKDFFSLPDASVYLRQASRTSDYD